jgi:hypothetical protein
MRLNPLPADRDLILLVADVLHPSHMFAVEGFLGGDMDHTGARRGAVPMLLVRRDPDDVAGLDLAHFAAPALHAPCPGNDEQRLAERMLCQAVRAPGSKRTSAERTRAGAGVSIIGSCHTVPVKLSAGPRRVGREPQL